MGLTAQLASNNSTYNTKTGGTHTSNVHHANTDHTSKMFKKGTVDLATANSHKVAGGAGGPSRSAAGAAGGLAAGGHGGQGGQVIIHHQVPPMPSQPDKMTSAELLGAAIGSTIAVILIIIAGAIICRSVYRDQTRTFKKRRDKKNAKKARDTESVSTASRSEEIERLTSVLPDVTVPPAQQGAPHRQAIEMLHAMTPLSQTCAIDSVSERRTGQLETTVQHAPVPSAPPRDNKKVRCQRRHVSSSDSDLSPIPHRDPRTARAWGLSRNQSRGHNKSHHQITFSSGAESHNTVPANCFPLSTVTRPEGSTDRGPLSSSPLTPRAHVTAPSQSLPTIVTGPMTRTNGTVTSGYSCPTGMPPDQFCTLARIHSSTNIGQPSLPTLPMSGSQGTELHVQDHHQFQRLNQTIDTQYQLINQLLQAQKAMNVSLPSMKKSSATEALPTPDNPHRSLHTADKKRQTRRDRELPPSTSVSATETLPQTPTTEDEDED